MCTVSEIEEAVKQELWHNSGEHYDIHNVIDGSGPHVSIGQIDVEVDGASGDDGETHLDEEGKFTGVAHISPEGNVSEVPRRIAFSGRCLAGKAVDFEFEWVAEEESAAAMEEEAVQKPERFRSQNVQATTGSSLSWQAKYEESQLDKRMFELMEDDE